jgi:hypothetical protein
MRGTPSSFHNRSAIRFDSPPEAGFAGREAYCDRRLSGGALRRLRRHPHRDAVSKEGVHGGTRFHHV